MYHNVVILILWYCVFLLIRRLHHILFYLRTVCKNNLFLKFYAILPLCTEVIMQSNSQIYIFIVVLECLLSNENKIPLNKDILFKYNLKENAYAR